MLIPNINDKAVHPDALSVIKCLQKNGYQAFIVGGGIRDLLVGLHPKDFDIATDATPNQVKKLFHNCRLIGRRFRLAHVYFKQHIIEVATFRGSHDNTEDPNLARSNNGMITRDNVFGSIEEDAQRRDFGVNALYYDPISNQVLDFTRGLKDLKKKQIHMIGDANTRMIEDPVRMLRAFRFANKLNFSIAPQTFQAIETNWHRLKMISSSRLYDEYQKLFTLGYARANFDSLYHHHFIDTLFPQVSHTLDQPHSLAFIRQALDNSDQRIQANKKLNPAFLLAALLWPTLQVQLHKIGEQQQDRFLNIDQCYALMEQILARQIQVMALPKRACEFILDIWRLQPNLVAYLKKSSAQIIHHRKFRAAHDFFMLRHSINAWPQQHIDFWAELRMKHSKAIRPMRPKPQARRSRGRRSPNKPAS